MTLSVCVEWQGLKDVVVPNNLSMELQIGTLQLRLDGDDGETLARTRWTFFARVSFVSSVVSIRLVVGICGHLKLMVFLGILVGRSWDLKD